MTAWTAHDTTLVCCCAAALFCIVVLIAWVRLTPFLAILVAALGFGLAAGMPMQAVLRAFEAGAGSLLGEIGLILALGAMLGGVLMESGAAQRLVEALLRPVATRPRLLPAALVTAAMLVGLPLFFEVGLVILLPVLFELVRRTKLPVVSIAVPVLAGLTALHALLPPHPGPLIAVSTLHADLGTTMALGFLVAVPAAVLAGPVYAVLLRRLPSMRTLALPAAPFVEGHAPVPPASPARHPGLGASLLVMLMPAALMLGRSAAETLLPPGGAFGQALVAIGSPVMALLLALVTAIVLLGWGLGRDRATMGRTLSGALPPLAVLLLTIGAGGGLKGVLLEAGIGHTVARVADASGMPWFLLAWLVAVALRQATGSATVATSATAGLLAPLLASGHATTVQGALVALAIGSGSVFFCHVNDAGFWMVNQFFRLSLKQTVLMWSMLQTIVSVWGLAATAGLWWALG
ncbi:GntP family permease [Acetobacteraceae bacterium KSS8]|uniref:GntP family permease n=1 Tax=Endosaccharibacter trunci TaxID=2812733 RepID=A0ABT1W8G6_9PROT|nr:GntP family permease [Acetobacteraceae bacterium KSS8]